MAPEPSRDPDRTQSAKDDASSPRIHNVLSDLIQQLNPGIFSVTLNTISRPNGLPVNLRGRGAFGAGCRVESSPPPWRRSSNDPFVRAGLPIARQPQLITGVSLKSRSHTICNNKRDRRAVEEGPDGWISSFPHFARIFGTELEASFIGKLPLAFAVQPDIRTHR